MRTISTLVLSGDRTSSGAFMLLPSTPATVSPFRSSFSRCEDPREAAALSRRPPAPGGRVLRQLRLVLAALAPLAADVDEDHLDRTRDRDRAEGAEDPGELGADED